MLSALSLVACHFQLCKDHRWWCHLKCSPFHYDISALFEWLAYIFFCSRGDAKHQSLSNNIPMYVTERFYATWLLSWIWWWLPFRSDLLKMLPSLTSLIISSTVGIGCLSRMIAFLAHQQLFLYFPLRHNWDDISSVVTTSHNDHIYNFFRIDDHLRIVQPENGLCMFFSCRVLDIFIKRALAFYTFVTLTTWLCTGISIVLPGQAVTDPIDWPNG